MTRRPGKLRTSLAAAFGLMTAVPVPGLRKIALSPEDYARGAAWYPLVGVCIAAATALAMGIAGSLGSGPVIIAVVGLATPLFITKFFHFDGLCDVLDAFLAGKSQEPTREIMKDSRIGAYALGGGGLYLLTRWALFLELARMGPALVLVPCFACSRLLATGFAARSNPVPGSTLGAGIVGRIGGKAFTIAILTFVASVVFAVWIFALMQRGGTGVVDPVVVLRFVLSLSLASLAALVSATLLASWSNKKIGGVNGDVLGAIIELSELAFIAVLLGGTSWLVRM